MNKWDLSELEKEGNKTVYCGKKSNNYVKKYYVNFRIEYLFLNYVIRNLRSLIKIM